MERFFVVTNEGKDKDGQVTGRVKALLEARGKSCILCEDAWKDMTADSIPKDIDCAIVIGGDGTLIGVARLLKKEVPIMGINMGTLGYLTEIEVDRIEESLDQILSGHYMLEDRMMLDGIFDDGRENVALNDIVLSRKGNLRIIHFNVYVNGTLLNSYEADGIVISTPTGSTAYNLSAGGPIVEPGAKLIVITPVCPHSLNKSSIILGANDKIVIEMCDNKGVEEERVASFDGELHCNLVSGDRVEIKMAKVHTQLVRTQQRSILQTISKKMING